MDSQNTPVHIRLWHRAFWQMALANLSLSMSVYMLFPILPGWLEDDRHLSAWQTGCSLAVFAVGLFLLGPLCSFLVQHYRRNKVCLLAVALLAGCLGVMGYVAGGRWPYASFGVVLLLRLVQGAAFGLAQMVLASTLVVDTSESYLRTEANHSMAWFGRMALALGPLAGLAAHVYLRMSVSDTLWVAVGCAAVAFVLIRTVNFPFRVPADHVPLFSTDRFWLGSGLPLFVNLLLVSVAVGIVVVQAATTVEFFLGVLLGYLLALLAGRYVFRDAELRSEAVSGLVLLVAAILLLMVRPTSSAGFAAAALTGLSVGLTGSRFLLLFIKLSRHCQRGTSQSTYMLSWESGLALGAGVGCALPASCSLSALWIALTLAVLSLALYNSYTCRWFERHKNR